MSSSNIKAEDLLLRNKRIIDPFNRLGCNIDPFLAVVEFCQVQGPRPLATVSLRQNRNLASVDVDSLSVWLMSSEAASGTVLLIYNQQMGIYALSYYATIYDIKARAFQRPICVALLTSERPTSNQLSRFSSGVRKLVAPLIKCNRRFFLRQLSDMIKISDAVESDTIQTYYTLDAEMLKQSGSNRKLSNVAEQARKLRPRMQALYDVLSESRTCMLLHIVTNTEAISISSSLLYEQQVPNLFKDLDCTGHAGEDQAAAEEMFLSFLQNPSLDPISDVTPCAYDCFIANLHSFLVQCSENQLQKGVLYSANTPILRFPKRTSPMKVKSSKSGCSSSTGGEETLHTISQHLDNVLFPVLAGEDMVVCGSEQRKQTVIDIVDKINFLKPKSHPNHSVVLWADASESRPKGVVGVCHDRSESAALNLRSTAVLDANACVLRTVPYRGFLLSSLSTKRRFPSDAALLAFVAATLTNISALVYLSRFLSPLHLENENISLDDERIIVNMLTELDLVKYQGLKCALEKRRSINEPTKVYLSRFLSPLHLENENISLDDERIIVNMLTELDLVKYQGLKCALEKRRSINEPTKVIQL
ncbi:hypothetical protein ANCDUO_09384 [Ancylostoma duodenale]|uniref:UDENN FLCN/SMCR8-type domain-containing protein n=1 Tax=Ancylostoma duodenale TaxID=51022 RepID=A0A0C2DD92_9BILA|nr:hypothetical protein ANCDUO_09384 [Ancylostoma duodenale]